jgi:signal transduction histidine kinase
MTRHILKIKEVAESISRGNFGVKLNLARDDEIGELADTIDYMSEELSKVEQLRKDLIANVSHELRTPLSLIRGYAETIKDVSGEDAEKREKGLNIIIDESERLGNIVDDILSLSQLQSGNFKLNREEVFISRAIKDIARKFEVLITEKKIEFVFKSLDEAKVLADRRKLEQVIYNLVGNAINYTPEGGAVEIKVDVINTLFRVSIWNSGKGISSAEIKNIWERYYRTENNDNNNSSTSTSIAIGTGLGLAIVKSILEAHNFEYGVESIEGEGTTFWFLCRV